MLGRAFGDLTLNCNVDYVKHDTSKVTGLSAMARYSFAGDAFRLTGRGELAQIDPGGGADKTTLTEFTLGGSIPLSAVSELRVEYRMDHTNRGVARRRGLEVPEHRPGRRPGLVLGIAGREGVPARGSAPPRVQSSAPRRGPPGRPRRTLSRSASRRWPPGCAAPSARRAA